MPEGRKIAASYVEINVEDKTEEGSKKIGGKLLAGFSALGLGAVVGKSINAGLDIQAGQSKLNAQLGLTKTQSGIAGKAAGKLFAGNYGTDMGQIQDAIKNVELNIGGMRGASVDTLTEVGTKALNTANIFDQDLGGVTTAVGQLMKTGLAKNAGEAFDIVTAGFQHGADKSGDFLDTLNEYGTQFRKMGISGEEATGIITQGLQAGARDGDLVADSIKEFSIRAVDGSTTTAAGFKLLGLNGKQMGENVGKGGKSANDALAVTLDKLRGIKDPVKQAQAATALFGTQAEDLGKALFAIHPETAAKGLGNLKGAADRANTAFNDNARANIGSFFRQLQSGATNVVGSLLIPGITKLSGLLSTGLGPAFSAVKRVAGEHTTTMKIAAGVLGIVTAALVATKIATMAASGATKVWGVATQLWSGITKVATGVQWLFNAAMSANPIMLVVIGIGLLIGALILAYHKVGWFRDLVNTAFGAMKAAGKAMWEHGVKPALDGMKAGFDVVGTAVAGLWNNILAPTIRFIVGAWLALASTIIHAAAGAFGWIPGLGGKLKSAARKFDGFKDDANAAIARVTRNLDLNVNTKPARDAISGLVRESSKTIYLHVVTIGGPGGVSGGKQVFAKGGFPHDGEFTVGEEGPELMRKSGSKLEVLTNRQLHHKLNASQAPSSNVRGMAGMHVDHLTLTVQADDIQKAADVYGILTDFAQRAGTGMNQEAM